MSGDHFSELQLFLDAFHFLRPYLLLLLLPLIAVWWMNRRAATRPADIAVRIAPHLRETLTVGRAKKTRYLPIDHVALLLALATIGAAGPSWTRQVDPFLAQTGPLVIVLEVTPSMQAADLPPNRLERAKFKIRDLLELRVGARTALVAYAGTAHRVLPFTDDPRVMLPYLEGLHPMVMPVEGTDASAALWMAEDLLTAEGGGGILYAADGFTPSDASTLNSHSSGGIAVLSMLPEGLGDRGLDQLENVPVVQNTPDNRDIQRLDRILNVEYRRALLQNASQPWEDRGWWLAWPAALLALVWFRRGWTMRWSAWLLGAFLALGPASQGLAQGLKDWFMTPDQQGFRAYNKKEYRMAADLFTDPMWKGHALYRAGRYDEAVQVLRGIETAQAAFTQGLAHVRNRQYRDGMRAFETALERDPNYPGAAENLETARVIVDYVEAAREASDTGEETGIGADDIVFDNESGRGTDTQSEAQPRGTERILTTEQWMNTVDTSTGDFLRYRFQFEAVRGE
jgi:Ca-activated chloride channel family protein